MLIRSISSVVKRGFSARTMDKVLKRVELHVHLDGSFRPATILELAKKNDIKLPSYTVEELKHDLSVHKPSSLKAFLDKFAIFLPTVSGYLDAIERVAYEFCEDRANDQILYVEARYSPHFLTYPQKSGLPQLTNDEVVQAVNKGFKRGQKDFGLTVRSILCCIRTEPDWSKDILELAEKYKHEGVVGIDLAGQEQLEDSSSGEKHIRVFQAAAERGIHRTVHAGENGPASVVREAINEMKTERIGHGYHSPDDPEVYKMIKDKDLHIEVCPISSVLTGSVPEDLSKHPAIQFTKDNLNWGINTDDPLVTGCTLSDDYDAVIKKMGLPEDIIGRCNLNAAKSCFLPENERKELVAKLEKIYHMKA